MGGAITGAVINSIMINAVSDEIDPDLGSAAKKGFDKEQKTLTARATKVAVNSLKNRTGLSGTNGFSCS